MKFFRFIPFVALLIYLAVKVTLFFVIDTDGGGSNSYVPTPAQQAKLSSVQAALKDYPDAAEDFSHLYFALGTVIGSDSVILKTTSDVRKAHSNSGALAVQAGEIPQVPGLSEAVNIFLSSEIGNENVALDSEKRKQVSDAFNALGWAAQQ